MSRIYCSIEVNLVTLWFCLKCLSQSGFMLLLFCCCSGKCADQRLWVSLRCTQPCDIVILCRIRIRLWRLWILLFKLRPVWVGKYNLHFHTYYCWITVCMSSVLVSMESCKDLFLYWCQMNHYFDCLLQQTMCKKTCRETFGLLFSVNICGNILQCNYGDLWWTVTVILSSSVPSLLFNC